MKSKLGEVPDQVGQGECDPKPETGKQKKQPFVKPQKHQEIENVELRRGGCGGFRLKVKQLYQITKHRNSRHS